jgi:RES domain-containing protein
MAVVLWRVSNYATLSGEGGLYVSGRWHTRGRPVVYCSLSPATALLETLVHIEIDAEDRPEFFHLLQVAGPERISRERLKTGLPEGWERDLAHTQSVGDQWLSEQRSLLLEVPSVLVPETWNVLINPLHREARLLKITKVYDHPFDVRFFR